jgi:hypothetical protein
VGKVVDTNWSSMISPADKSRLLARTQELLAAVKQARQRANSVETSQVAIAKNLTDFIVG